jgi:hypothetical protein
VLEIKVLEIKVLEIKLAGRQSELFDNEIEISDG